jgi:hypothetical protein
MFIQNFACFFPKLQVVAKPPIQINITKFITATMVLRFLDLEFLKI